MVRVALVFGAALMLWVVAGYSSAQVACAHDPRFVCSPRSVAHPVAVPDAGKSWAYYGGLAEGQNDTFSLVLDRATTVPWNLLVDARDAGNSARPEATLYDVAGRTAARLTFSRVQTFYEPFSRESYVESETLKLHLLPGYYKIVVSMPGARRQRYVMAIGEAERFSPFEIPYVLGAIARIRSLRY